MTHGAIKSSNHNEALTRNGKPSELSDKELDEVSGGKVVDAGAPILFRNCCSGQRYAQVTIAM
jgi:bacteriocin-like protein